MSDTKDGIVLYANNEMTSSRVTAPSFNKLMQSAARLPAIMGVTAQLLH
jgi:hypothetical protein